MTTEPNFNIMPMSIMSITRNSLFKRINILYICIYIKKVTGYQSQLNFFYKRGKARDLQNYKAQQQYKPKLKAHKLAFSIFLTLSSQITVGENQNYFNNKIIFLIHLKKGFWRYLK